MVSKHQQPISLRQKPCDNVLGMYIDVIRLKISLKHKKKTFRQCKKNCISQVHSAVHNDLAGASISNRRLIHTNDVSHITAASSGGYTRI